MYMLSTWNIVSMYMHYCLQRQHNVHVKHMEHCIYVHVLLFAEAAQCTC